MFLTGEFSRVGRVSKRLLQYYDEIGLLTPAHTDPQTGYRYYSAKQLPRLNRILALKDLGLTLQQIARMLEDDVSDAEIRGMLMMQKAEIEKTLREDLDRLKRIESRLQSEQVALPEVAIKSIPAQEILSVPHFCLGPEDGFNFIGYLMKHLPAKVPSRSLGHLIAMSDADEFRQENIDLEFGFFKKGKVPDEVTLSDELTMTTRTLPPIEKMATTVFVGDSRKSSVAYGALGAWIENNGYRVAGLQREIFIEVPRDPMSRDIVLEIQFPVERSDDISIRLN
ncbi:MAG: MerR family transcriptional regulator [Chloroflexota bacterium]